jgi:hypothetical protein
MTDKPLIRASSLPRVLKCPASGLNPDGLQAVQTHNDAADNGTIVHKVLERYLKDGWDVSGDLIDGVEGEQERDRCLDMVDRGVRMIDRFPAKPIHPEMEVQIELDSCIITGHVDVVVESDDRLGVVDWKTGRMEADHYHQVMAYAAGVRRAFKRDCTVHVSVVHLDSGEVDRYQAGPEGLEEWEDMVNTTIENGGYSVNRECVYCPLKATCPAYSDYASWSALPVRRYSDEGPSNLPAINQFLDFTPSQRAEVWRRLREIEKAVRWYKGEVKQLAKSMDSGSIDLGDSVLQLEQASEKTVNTPLAMPVVGQYLEVSEIGEVVSLNLGEALNRVADHTPHGKKAAVKRKVMDELEKAGAIEWYTFDRLMPRQKKT